MSYALQLNLAFLPDRGAKALITGHFFCAFIITMAGRNNRWVFHWRNGIKARAAAEQLKGMASRQSPRGE